MPRPPRRRGRAAAWHLLLLGCFIAAGIGVTWPMTAKLADGQLPWNPDVASYVWALWWLAHQVAHLGNPFATTYMAAPVGIQLGFDTLMPLPGLIMTPVTLLWGPDGLVRRADASSRRACCATPPTARPGCGWASRAPSPPGPCSACPRW